jgi:pectate lyase
MMTSWEKARRFIRSPLALTATDDRAEDRSSSSACWAAIAHRRVAISRFATALLAFACCLAIGGTAEAAPIGWAVVDDMGVASTTGGGDGSVVVARTADELADHAGREEPLTILIEGALTGSGKLRVASNKTLLGVGASASITGVELSLNDVSNVIIRNLTMTGARDAIALRGSHHVWVDHCDLSACDDGLLDITHRSDYVTVSWTRFSDHHKTMLINSGTSQPEDAGTLNTTIHHCWFDGSNTRNPRVGYGQVHIFNSLYNGNGYGIGLHSQARVLAERNHFDGVKDPVKQMYREDPASPHHGFCEGIDNIFHDCTGQQAIEGISFPVDDYYRYDFALDEAGDVATAVREGAGPGASFGTLGPLPVPGDGALGVSVQPSLRWTRGREGVTYRVAFGEANPPGSAVETDGQTFDPGTLQPGAVYYWRVDQVTGDGSVAGDVWRFQTQPNE